MNKAPIQNLVIVTLVVVILVDRLVVMKVRSHRETANIQRILAMNPILYKYYQINNRLIHNCKKNI